MTPLRRMARPPIWPASENGLRVNAEALAAIRAADRRRRCAPCDRLLAPHTHPQALYCGRRYKRRAANDCTDRRRAAAPRRSIEQVVAECWEAHAQAVAETAADR